MEFTMWNQNPNFPPSNSTLKKGIDEFRLRVCSNPMSQKLEPSRDHQPWLDSSMNFSNQVPPRFTGQRQRFPSNISPYNTPLQKFSGNRNIRKSTENFSVDPWSNAPRFQNSLQNFDLLPPENRQQLNDNYNRFHSPMKSLDVPGFEPYDQQPSVGNRLNSPLSSLEKRFLSKSDIAMNADKTQLGLDQLNPTQRRWENKSNRVFEQKLMSDNCLSGTNTFQSQQHGLEGNTFFPDTLSSPSHFSQSPMHANRLQQSQQNMTDRFQSVARSQGNIDRSTSDLPSLQQNLNYRYATNTPTTMSCSMNQSSLNRLTTSLNFPSQYTSVNQTANADQNPAIFSCADMSQGGEYKNSNNNMQFSNQMSTQQQNFHSPHVSNTSMNNRLTGLSQFTSPGHSDNLQKGNSYGQFTAASTCNNNLFADSFSHRHSDDITSHDIGIFSPQFKVDNVSSFDPKSSKSNQFDSMQNDGSLNNSQSNNTIPTTICLPQPTFTDPLFMNAQSYSDIDGTASKNVHLCPPAFDGSVSSDSKLLQGCAQPAQDVFTKNTIQTSQELGGNTHEKLNTSSTFPFPSHNFNSPLFENNEPYKITKAPSMYPSETKFEDPLHACPKSSETKQFNTSQQVHKLNELTSTQSISAPISYSSPCLVASVCQSTSNQPESIYSMNTTSSANLLLPDIGSQSDIPSKPIVSTQLDTLSTQVSANYAFDRNNSCTSGSSLDSKTLHNPGVFDHLAVLGPEPRNPMETTFAETSASHSNVNISSPDFLSSITGELLTSKLNVHEPPINTYDNIEQKALSTTTSVQNFSGSSGNQQINVDMQLPGQLKEDNSICSSPQLYIARSHNMYQTRTVKDGGNSSESMSNRSCDDAPKKHLDTNSEASLQSNVPQELNSPDVIYDATSMCQSSFIDAEHKYDAIPFLGDVGHKDKVSPKTEEIATSFNDVINGSDVGKQAKGTSRGETILETSISKEIKGIPAVFESKNSKSIDQVEKIDIPTSDNKSTTSEPVTSKGTSADLPSFDISQVLNDPKMLNDILHAAKAIQLTDFSQAVTFPSSSSSSLSKSIAIVPPLQNESPVSVSSISRNSSSLSASPKLLEKRKMPLHFPSSLTMTGNDQVLIEDSASLAQAFTKSCDMIQSQVNKIFCDDQPSNVRTRDTNYSTSFQSSPEFSEPQQDQNLIDVNEKTLKRVHSDLLESVSKIQKKDPDVESSETMKQDLGNSQEKNLAGKDEKIVHDSDVTSSELFSLLTQCPVNNDEDANLILKVMSMLLELFLKYKLRDVPELERMVLIESLRAGHSTETEKVFKHLQGSLTPAVETFSVSQENHATETPAATSFSVKDKDFDLATVASVSTAESININTTASENMFVPMLPQPAMYSNCPVNMPMSFWMTSGTPLMSVPTIPETMPASQYPPLPPPPMISATAPPPLPPPPPPQFTMEKPPLPPQLPMDHPPLPPLPPPCE